MDNDTRMPYFASLITLKEGYVFVFISILIVIMIRYIVIIIITLTFQRWYVQVSLLFVGNTFVQATVLLSLERLKVYSLCFVVVLIR